MPRKLSNSSSSSSSSKPSTSTSRSRPPPPAAAFTQEESDSEAGNEDSEEDEWDVERTNSGKQSNSVFQQDDEESESEEDSEDGMAAYESDQGEVIEEEDMNEEVIPQYLSLYSNVFEAGTTDEPRLYRIGSNSKSLVPFTFSEPDCLLTTIAFSLFSQNSLRSRLLPS